MRTLDTYSMDLRALPNSKIYLKKRAASIDNPTQPTVIVMTANVTGLAEGLAGQLRGVSYRTLHPIFISSAVKICAL